MVDELHAHRRRTRTLSDSSRSDVPTYSGSDSSETVGNNGCSPPKQDRCNRSRKHNIRELREEFNDYPELYGIRRSNRSRKEPFRFRPPGAYSDGLVKRRKRTSYSSSDHDRSSGSDSDNCWSRKADHRCRSVRTRGNRVNYKSAFADESSDDSDDNPCERSASVSTRQLPSHNQHSQQSSFQKPKGPLVRKLNSTSLSPRLPGPTKPLFQPTKETELNSHASDEDVDNNYRASEWNDEEDADVIEEVLTHAVRRKGATGNPTTMYNCKLEKDPNANFDPTSEPGELQFLIKWRNWSHIHSTWETEASLHNPDRGCPVYGFKKLLTYQTMLREREERLRHAERDDLETLAYEEEREEQILEDKMNVERIVAHSRDPVSNTFDYFIKWFRLDYRYCTWESGKVIRALYMPAVESYEARCRTTSLPDRKCEFLSSRPKFNPLTEQPSYLGDSNDCRLRDYQLEGINWIARAWCRGNSVILADEMGLGKTIQTIGFLSYLFHEHGIFGPFLIVVPLSTVPSWQKELQAWAPQMNSIMYTGDHISRQLIREHEWSVSGSSGNRRQLALKFNVCVTTYEILLKDKYWLGQVPWSFLGVDEAHRLKNDSSQLYKTLKTFDTNTRLLITGTPLQNTMKELWALLHFIMPEKFPCWEEFEQSYNLSADDPIHKNDGETFHNLHKVLRPFLLRRVKKDVESSLPEKIEQILRVDMTKEQANIYRLILARNYDGLMKVTRGHRASFINIVMELKKCCNHAHLIAPPQDSLLDRMANEEYLLCLIRGSGKMTLLDKLLQRLKSNGHRVLIFSQMVRMLDLIARYLTLRCWGFQRLDGSVRGTMRRQALDHFNAEGSTDFCFLLSTRAGGLGINLATADTVIIFDSDWNPQNDLQAQARAHRIGQTKQVSVYRLVTRDSVEEKIIESATRKMVLDHLVIQRMDSACGRNSTFRKGDTTKGQLLTEILRYGAEGLFKHGDEDVGELEVDIDDVLKRAETRDTEASAEANPANALLSSFKVASLDAPDEEPDIQTHAEPFKGWDEIIPSELRGQLKAEEIQKTLVDLELGPRRRKQVKTFQAGLDTNSSTTSASEDEGAKAGSSQLSEKEVRALVRALRRFARPLERIDAIAADAELPDRTETELRCIVDTILKGCQAVIQNSASSDDHQKSTGKGPVFQYGKVSIAAKPLLHSIEYLEILHQCLPVGSKEARMTFELPFLPKPVAWSCPWDVSDDVRLLAGVYEHGYDNWEAIKLDSELGMGSKLLPVSPSERPQASHVRSRVDYLLKMLAKHRHQKVESDSLDGSTGKKRKRQEADSIRSDLKPKPRSEPQKKHKTASKSVRQTEVGASFVQPKSAEFVETDDSSSDSCDEGGLKSNDSAAIKRSKHDRCDAHVREHFSGESQGTLPPKNDHSSSPHSGSEDLSSFSFPISKEEDNDFHNMRGPLFLKCKEKLLPIKKHFKRLEHLEDASEEDTRQFAKVILRIGDHIHSLVRDVSDKNIQHSWKGYLWDFVQIFSKKSTDELRQIYRRAVKRRHKDSDTPTQHSHPENSVHDNTNSDASKFSRSNVNAPWKHSHRTRSEITRQLGSDSRDHLFHRDALHRTRNDSRFDNAFNRPPTSFGIPQDCTNSRSYPFNPSQRYRTHNPYSPHPSALRTSLPNVPPSVFLMSDTHGTTVPPTQRLDGLSVHPLTTPNPPVVPSKIGAESCFNYPGSSSSRDPRLASVRR